MSSIMSRMPPDFAPSSLTAITASSNAFAVGSMRPVSIMGRLRASFAAAVICGIAASGDGFLPAPSLVNAVSASLVIAAYCARQRSMSARPMTFSSSVLFLNARVLVGISSRAVPSRPRSESGDSSLHLPISAASGLEALLPTYPW